jgi:hypothetical protein
MHANLGKKKTVGTPSAALPIIFPKKKITRELAMV